MRVGITRGDREGYCAPLGTATGRLRAIKAADSTASNARGAVGARRARGEQCETAGRGVSAKTPPGSIPRGVASTSERSVLEQQLPVLRQRPEVVRNHRLQRVDDLAQRVLR